MRICTITTPNKQSNNAQIHSIQYYDERLVSIPIPLQQFAHNVSYQSASSETRINYNVLYITKHSLYCCLICRTRNMRIYLFCFWIFILFLKFLPNKCNTIIIDIVSIVFIKTDRQRYFLNLFCKQILLIQKQYHCCLNKPSQIANLFKQRN